MIGTAWAMSQIAMGQHYATHGLPNPLISEKRLDRFTSWCYNIYSWLRKR
jgi:hypothetical protein